VTGRIRALFLLAISLVRTLVRGLLGRRRGLRTFRENYSADAVVPLTAEEHRQMLEFGGCIGCGLCDRGEAARVIAAAGAYPGLMGLVVAASRSMPDLRAAARGWRLVPPDALAEREQVCPTRVPLQQMARFVERKAHELGRAAQDAT
jgi:succinate dehydrogenase/fumarate reductase-like Fe-S protein